MVAIRCLAVAIFCSFIVPDLLTDIGFVIMDAPIPGIFVEMTFPKDDDVEIGTGSDPVDRGIGFRKLVWAHIIKAAAIHAQHDGSGFILRPTLSHNIGHVLDPFLGLRPILVVLGHLMYEVVVDVIEVMGFVDDLSVPGLLNTD